MQDNIKFLVIGASGLVGQAAVKASVGRYEVYKTHFGVPKPGYLTCDITDRAGLEALFKQVKPTHVLHCGQLAGGLDFCEKNPGIAKKFHFDGTVNLGKACLKHNAKLVFISTECVFDGKKEVYTEDDAVNPLSVYGKFKAESEKWLTGNMGNYIVARTMTAYGWDPATVTPNALMKVYFALMKKETIFVPDFRWSSPTYAGDLAAALVEMSLSRHNGLFHVTGSSFIDRYQWLKKTCEFLGWDVSLLKRQAISDQVAGRPLKVRLDTTKFRNTFKTKLHTLEEALVLLKQDMR